MNTTAAPRLLRGISCFRRGMNITTPDGTKRVEDLRQGDLVVTRDNGPQPVLWRAGSKVIGEGPAAPIRLAKGFLGATEPLELSGAHRVLLDHKGVSKRFDVPEILFPAKGLIDGTVVQKRPTGELRYFHILLEGHEILQANGVWCESLLLGDHLPETISPSALREFRRTVGIDMPTVHIFEPARRLVEVGKGRGIRQAYGLDARKDVAGEMSLAG
ncbi:MAG: Hint domain-containing protein [Pseudomonadota bacterium]